MKNKLALKIFIVISVLINVILLPPFVEKTIYDTFGSHRGVKSEMIKSSFVSWKPGNDNVSFYMVKKGEHVWCEFVSEDNKFYFCTWYFSKYHEPVLGWFDANSVDFIPEGGK
jgi:hypothetical protein